MLRRLALTLLALFIAIPGGVLSARLALDRMAPGGDRPGWTPLLDTGSEGPYEAARRAITGTLPLGRAESLAFSASRDADGRVLSRTCTYRIEGPLPPARFWTLYAALPDLTPLPPLGVRPAALHAFQTLRPPEGGIAVTAGALPAAGNWLAVSGAGPMILVLALYDPASAEGFGFGAPVLPPIRRLACDV